MEEHMTRKKFEDLTITDDFMFCKIMQDSAICQKVLNLVLGDKIGMITKITYQKVMDEGNNTKSIRLDVYAGDDAGRVYDVEMQAADQKNLGKRMRYYQSMIDIDNLESGKNVDYNDLPESFIICFCLFDYPGRGIPVYTFKNVCMENREVLLPDGMTKVVLNSQAAHKAADPGMMAFLEYMNGKVSDDGLVRELEKKIEEIKANSERRNEYMALSVFESDIKREAREEGRTMGLEAGRLATLAELVRSGDISLEKAAQKAGLPTEEFCKRTKLPF